MRRKWEVPLYLGLGLLLGLGIASVRSGWLDPGVQAQPGPVAAGQKQEQPKKGEPGGVFSPPGTSESGTVTPPNLALPHQA